MSEYRLIEEILQLSVSKTWDSAKQEWVLDNIYITVYPEQCLCGHFPIIELCEIRYKLNGRITTVGNHCVKKFLELPSEEIFQGIRKIQKDITKSLNDDAVQYAKSKKWIDEWQYDFYLDTIQKRKLTDKQREKREEINQKVINIIKRSSHNPK